jgi:hypothetical protein
MFEDRLGSKGIISHARAKSRSLTASGGGPGEVRENDSLKVRCVRFLCAGIHFKSCM